MDKEVIELIKGLAGDASTVVIWYFVLDTIQTLISACGWVGVFWASGHFAVRVAKVCNGTDRLESEIISLTRRLGEKRG